MVEKSKKNPPGDAKYGKIRQFLGDRLFESNRDTSLINNLRAAQPAPILLQTLAV